MVIPFISASGAQVADDQILANLSRRVRNEGAPVEGVLVIGVGQNTPASRAGIRGTVRTAQGVALGACASNL